MLVCDRCGEKLSINEREQASSSKIIYVGACAYTGSRVDLCKNCHQLFQTYKNKMESYFMVNENPIKILDGKVYWDEYKKYR